MGHDARKNHSDQTISASAALESGALPGNSIHH
jgi:hypothetical protein